MYCSRMVCEVSFHYKAMPAPDIIVIRCTAHKNDLDAGGGRRSRDHTELLVSELELGVLWEEYGLVGDIVVSLFIVLQFHVVNSGSHLIDSLSQMTFPVPTFIALFPRISFINSSRAPSRTIWSLGLRNICYRSMVVHIQIKYLMISTAGMPFFCSMLLHNDDIF